MLIAGATGGVGRELVRLAAAAGHQVVVVARHADTIPATPQVIPLALDLSAATPAALGWALDGIELIINAVGPRGRPEAGVQSATTAALLAAVGDRDVRLLMISAAPLATIAATDRPYQRDSGDGPVTRWLLMPIVKRVFKDQYADIARAESALAVSHVRWTIVRPPRLLNGPATGRYRTAIDRNVRGGNSIRRADLALAMLDIAADPTTVHHAVGVSG